jgi:hypothetical protein
MISLCYPVNPKYGRKKAAAKRIAAASENERLWL